MRRRTWTHAEIILVVRRYCGEGPAPVARELGRSEDSVSSLARRYGQRTPRRPYRKRAKTRAGAA